ncbi:MAG TPA: YiiX/YebB-like N1pC/P60 family cysteine hydrolase [Candidatus Binataceae bacterium]|nr:YiiX/YebB-like N1pC/P60 family cysteine hydrolase [Candidatus Binataceae bacterium]
MAKLARLNPIPYILRRMTDAAIGLLTKPVARYTLTIPNDLQRLKQHVRKGDVILVEGNERVSEVIKYLTQSSWSHSALYVGDEPLRRDPEVRRALIERWGEEASYLVVEALVESGVVLSPIAKYRDFNVRICRPYNLMATDQAAVIDHAVRTVGRQYDFKNMFDLARYFLPVTIVPARLRRRALQFGSTDPTRVICSSLIAESFAQVRFPIVPQYEPIPPGQDAPRGGLRPLERFARRVRMPDRLLRVVAPTLITPRDFDLSPYFAIIKYNIIEGSKFDYHKLVWAEQPAPAADKLEKSA